MTRSALHEDPAIPFGGPPDETRRDHAHAADAVVVNGQCRSNVHRQVYIELGSAGVF
jgi:hypothetical protein